MLLLSLLPLRSSFLILFIMIWHIRYLLCYLKTPFGEWGEYIYIYKFTRGCPPQYCPPCALVPRSLRLPVQRVRLLRSEHIAPNSRTTGIRCAHPNSTNSRTKAIQPGCECVGRIYYFLVVSRPKGQISLDIYVGYSFVSSYVNVQIGCWL